MRREYSMTQIEGQPSGIYNLLTASSREDPYVRKIVGLLEASDIVTPEDLIATPTGHLEEILPSAPRYPYSPLTMGTALKAAAESNERAQALWIQHMTQLSLEVNL